MTRITDPAHVDNLQQAASVEGTVGVCVSRGTTVLDEDEADDE